MWIIFAISSAVFAALTSIFAKIGIENINSNVATAIRTLVVLIMAWIMVFLTGQHTTLGNISQKNWMFLTISGLSLIHISEPTRHYVSSRMPSSA